MVVGVRLADSRHQTAPFRYRDITSPVTGINSSPAREPPDHQREAVERKREERREKGRDRQVTLKQNVHIFVVGFCTSTNQGHGTQHLLSRRLDYHRSTSSRQELQAMQATCNFDNMQSCRVEDTQQHLPDLHLVGARQDGLRRPLGQLGGVVLQLRGQDSPPL